MSILIHRTVHNGHHAYPRKAGGKPLGTQCREPTGRMEETMARPVKIANIGTRNHAQKLKRALRRTYPAWTITIGRQDDGKLTLSAVPPAAQGSGQSDKSSRVSRQKRHSPTIDFSPLPLPAGGDVSRYQFAQPSIYPVRRQPISADGGGPAKGTRPGGGRVPLSRRYGLTQPPSLICMTMPPMEGMRFSSKLSMP